jgi:predicted MFS family arabinose efflux permease
VISGVVAPEKLGRALGLHAIGGSASFFIAPLTAAAIAAVFGWRGAFIGVAVPAMILGIILYIALAKISVKKGTTAGVQAESETRPLHLRRIVFFIILSTFAHWLSLYSPHRRYICSTSHRT